MIRTDADGTGVYMKSDVKGTDVFLQSDASPMCAQDPETDARTRNRKNALHLRSFRLSRPPCIGSVWRPSLATCIILTADVRSVAEVQPYNAASRIV